MLPTKPRFLSFEEYLSYDDGIENLYELFNGELVQVPPESGFNIEIANFLFSLFLPIVGYRRLRGHGLELEVRGEPLFGKSTFSFSNNEIRFGLIWLLPGWSSTVYTPVEISFADFAP